MPVRSTFPAIFPALLLVLSGCQHTGSPVSFAGADTVPPSPAVGQRALATNAPALQAAIDQAGPESDTTWALYRNDARLTTQAGYHGGTYEYSYTITYDRQSQSNGHVHDHFSSTAYQRRYRESAR